MAATKSYNEAIWKVLLRQKMITIHCDSQFAICIAKNSLFHSRRTRHTNHHFVCGEVEVGELIAKIFTQMIVW